jgi:hypothetical protein
MNKRLLTVALMGAAVTTAAACNDNFLTEVPSDFVSPANFYSNAGDAVTAVNAAYATFIDQRSPLSNSDYLGRNTFMLINYPTEVVTSRLSASNERSLIGNYNTQFNSAHAYLETTWQAAYSGINRANSVIDRVPGVPMDATRKAQIIGEAKFLRAVHYYILAGLFGGVPLKLSETTAIGGANLARASAAETWAQIEKDLSDAAAVLPTSWPATDFGRATKGGALALLGKAYLQAAATGAGGATDYQKADSVLRIVTTLGYGLDSNYASLFDGSNEKSKEIVWSFQNIRAPGAGGYLAQWFAPNTSPAIFAPGAQNQFQAERPFYDSYNPADTLRKKGTWLTSFVNNGATITWAWTSGIQAATKYGSTGPVPRKFLDLGAPDAGAEGIDYPFLRYAEVLLNLAEAIDATAGPTPEAYGLIDQVRTRAGTPALTPGLTAAQFKDSLFLERRYELAVEFTGVFDNRRNWPWAKARVERYMDSLSVRNKSPFTSSVEKFDARPIPDKWTLYPIPLHACELNPLLVQNPGWNDGVCKDATP